MNPVRPLQIWHIGFSLYEERHNTYMVNSLHKLWSCGVNIKRFGGLTG